MAETLALLSFFSVSAHRCTDARTHPRYPGRLRPVPRWRRVLVRLQCPCAVLAPSPETVIAQSLEAADRGRYEDPGARLPTGSDRQQQHCQQDTKSPGGCRSLLCPERCRCILLPI
ncbi:hypothetical protein NDU88_007417 [Pleurodeles waltl]|uniref:Secreted protein n=1 Tax=Pleurodeles waltl TaxID=8319 RepID=A0AAV7LVE1_PLEWA|nr:hypothetical protein NDU88_007417 [Pleurodeles waltl]